MKHRHQSPKVGNHNNRSDESQSISKEKEC